MDRHIVDHHVVRPGGDRDSVRGGAADPDAAHDDVVSPIVAADEQGAASECDAGRRGGEPIDRHEGPPHEYHPRQLDDSSHIEHDRAVAV